MKWITNILLAITLLGLDWNIANAADEHRYISIRNTDSMWTQGVCSLAFRLDNGGAGEFSNLSITLQLRDKAGNALSEGILIVPPFGDSDATRSVDAATEFSCETVENASAIAITQAVEQRGNNTLVKLPLSTFDPQRYQPLKIVLSDNP
ncbi:hypothetical protein GW590_04835 [Rahnella sp. SAP-1]|jgi:hypothetical protein|uniref:Uncharacterized protein n=1 Tax=Rouxiella aceris TaxID=2703884 RepID=A0A848MDK9_9GAMM|nr:IrmA family protein [Rouxiella aceris]NMP26197.1 hypothetical protein [Rouxiella aceris]